MLRCTRHHSPICHNNTRRTAQHRSAAASTTRTRMGTPCRDTQMAQMLAVFIPSLCRHPTLRTIIPRRPGIHRKHCAVTCFFTLLLLGSNFVDILVSPPRTLLMFCAPPSLTSAPVSRSPAHFILRIFTAKLCFFVRHFRIPFFFVSFLLFFLSFPLALPGPASSPPHTLFDPCSQSLFLSLSCHIPSFLDRRTIKI